MNEKRRVWYYIKNYKFNSLIIKNFLLIMILIVIPLIGLNIGIYAYYGKILEDEIAAANESSISRVRDTVDMIFNEAAKLSLRIAYDNGVTKFMLESRQMFTTYNDIEILRAAISTVSISTGDYIHSIYAYSSANNYVISSLEGGGIITDFKDNEWAKEFQVNKEVSTIQTKLRKVDTKNGNTLNMLSFMINTPVNECEKRGLVIVNVDLSELGKLIDNVNKNREEKIYIISETGQILFSNDVESMGMQAKDVPYLKAYLNETKSNVIDKVYGIDHVITTTMSNNDKWEYVSVLPLRSYQFKINNLKRILIFLSALCVIIAVIVATLISLRVFTPIRDIIALLEKPEEFQYKDKLENSKRGVNEIKFIISNIFNNINKSKIMEEELERRMAMLKQARTLALQSQINPHFLYNTLQTINWLIMGLTKGENEVSKVVTSLSKLLRATLDSDNFLISIENEVNYAKEYIEIQKVRYKDKFNVEWLIEQAIFDYQITQITLQPVLENCIYHGIKPKKDKGIIRVQASLENEDIVFEVSDNGVGMSVEEIEKINSELKEDYIQSSYHIGIRNINQRIKLIFGESYGIYLSQNRINGLKVKIVIPKVKKDIP